jgi:hypothetical protein
MALCVVPCYDVKLLGQHISTSTQHSHQRNVINTSTMSSAHQHTNLHINTTMTYQYTNTPHINTWAREKKYVIAHFSRKKKCHSTQKCIPATKPELFSAVYGATISSSLCVLASLRPCGFNGAPKMHWI